MKANKKVLKIESLLFSKTSFWGPQFYSYIEFLEEGLRVRSCNSDERVSEEVLRGDNADPRIHEKKLGLEARHSLHTLLLENHVMDWKNDYVDSEVLDGTQWELVIAFKGKKPMQCDGSNAYPENWQQVFDFMKALSEPLQ